MARPTLARRDQDEGNPIVTVAGQRPVSPIPHDRDAAKAVGPDGIGTGAEA
jgi:hypothetical protein